MLEVKMDESGPMICKSEPKSQGQKWPSWNQMAKKLKIFLCPNNLHNYKYGAGNEIPFFLKTNVFLEKEFCQTKKIIDKLFCQNSLRHSFFSKSWVKYYSTIILSKIFWQYLSKKIFSSHQNLFKLLFWVKKKFYPKIFSSIQKIIFFIKDLFMTEMFSCNSFCDFGPQLGYFQHQPGYYGPQLGYFEPWLGHFGLASDVLDPNKTVMNPNSAIFDPTWQFFFHFGLQLCCYGPKADHFLPQLGHSWPQLGLQGAPLALV